MAATEFDIIRDEQERNNLLLTITDVEKAITASTPGARRILENTVENVKNRIATLDKKIEEAKVEHAAEVQAQVVAAAALAAKETKLNASERETYRSFLEESYFTKKDFGKLDAFYAHSYDRLSEGGKEEMSKRIHEGIKRGEFKFTDLPSVIQEKDNEHCSAKTNKEASAQVHINKSNSSQAAKPANKTAVKDIDVGSIDLSGIRLADATGSPSASSLPDGSGAKVAQR